MRRANRTIPLFLCLILALSACAAADEPPAKPAQSAPLFDSIPLG